MIKQLTTNQLLVYNLVSCKNGIQDFLKNKETKSSDMQEIMSLLRINNLEHILELSNTPFKAGNSDPEEKTPA